MNIAIIGYGRMGHEIEETARKRGHTAGLIIDIDNTADLNEGNLKGIDVAIEFSLPESAVRNITDCLTMGVPVVSGTTGWLEQYDKVKELCLKHGTSFLHSTNFSIGVNLLFRLNSQLAEYMSRYEEYAVSIEEIHHTKKLDAPSGTAITLAEGIKKLHPGYRGWCFANEKAAGMVPVKSVREGLVPGTHVISWDSEVDMISLKHEAKNRKGLALGAIIAAEYIYTRKGVYTMNDVLGF